MDYTISLASLFWISAGLGSLLALYLKIREPIAKRIKQIDSHEDRLQKLEDHIEERQSTDILVLKSLNAIVNNMLDKADTEKLIKVRDELQNGVIEKHK